MEQELTAYNEDRTRQFTLLLEKQRRELAQIDSEITNLGINVAELAESMQDIHFYPTNDSSLTTASMMSLPRSVSSNAFVSNPTNGNGTSAHN